MEERLGCFQVLAVVRKVPIDIHLCFCVDINFQLLWVNTKECNCWTVWWEYVWLIRDHQIVLQNVRTLRIPMSNEWEFPLLPSLPACGVIGVLDFGILRGLQWQIVVVLTCISLTTNDVEHLFICYFVICPSSVRCLLRSLAHFLSYFLSFFLFFVLLSFLGSLLRHMEIPQAKGGAVATSLCQSHSNMGSEPSLWPTPQLTATPDP